MPVTAGGYEAVVSLDERLRQQADVTSKLAAHDHSMAAVYQLCPTSPEDYCNLYENLSYSWMAPIQKLALRRSLKPTDVWRLRSINDTRLLFRKFKALEHVQIAAGRRPRLLSRILRANANDILLDACFKLISVSFAYLGTYILKSILDQIQIAASPEGNRQPERGDAPSDSAWTPRQKAFVYACIGLGLTVIRFLAELQNYHHARQVGLRIRSTLVVSLFEKALKRRDLSGQTKAPSAESSYSSTSNAPQTSRRSRAGAKNPKVASQEQGADVGKIVNMMASDVNILLRMGCDLHQLYGAPLEVTIAAIFLYKLMGWSALVGFGILVAAIPVNYYWGEIAVKKQREYSSARDERMSLMTELIDAMRFVKIQGVEPQWERRVASARHKEIRKLIWSRVMTFLFELLWTVIPVLVTLVSFFFYVKVAKEELTVATAFTAIALFTMIRPPLNAIPGFLMGGLIAMVSVQRLESFLNEQEVEEAVSQLSRQRGPQSSGGVAESSQDLHDTAGSDSQVLKIEGCSFHWHSSKDSRSTSGIDGTSPSDSSKSSFNLRDISITFPVGKLTLIVGPTGSGKSSLLAAVLGEMLQSEEGSIIRNKFDSQGNSRFSFASQLPWLEAGKSVRDNILFGTAFDKGRYAMCVHACALQADLDSMEDGDQTRIGSHTVSGGQKARISLARALYARSGTVLLDDVLSAVDTRVQNHIVKHAVLGPIAKGRRVILVTHHVHLLVDDAALVVSMQNGRVTHQGEPAELQSQGIIPPSHGQKRRDPGHSQDKASASTSAPLISPAQAPPQGSSLSADAADNTSTAKGASELASGARTPRLLHEEEKRREGAVSWIFYRTYLQASSLRIWGLLVLFLLLLRMSESFGQYWLKVWGEAYQKYGLQAFATKAASHLPFDPPPADGHAGFYLTIYGLSGFAVILFNSSRAVCFYVASIRASQNLFATLLANVIRAPLRWFDITPAGRIMNRFGTDMDCIDNILPQSIMNLGNNAFSMAAYFLICVVIVPAFLLPSFLLVLLGPWLVGGFLACTRDMQRIEATSTSPIYGHFQQALSGIVTIRAFGAEPRLLESFLDAVDLYQSLWWAVCTMEVWLSFRSQILGGVSVFIVTLLALSGAVSPGSAGLALSSAQLLCQLAYYLVNDFKNLANSFNSLERVSEYQSMPREETDLITSNYSSTLLPAAWPSARARIVFDNVSLRYADDLPTVLKGVSFDVRPSEKVGIIGRTGSGKSSLASSLFRATELCGGRITIDDVDIATIPLQQLRSRLSIVMQDPVLFSGTVRDNLDPFEEHGDAEVMAALSRVGLAPPLGEARLVDVDETTPGEHRSSMRLTLDTPVSSGGANFSAGQAQLLSLARSLLRSTRILILDEATSSTDMDTDAMVQRVIRTALKDSIVICIAHRLRSVIDYDRVVVMQDGKLVEVGRPKELLEKEDGDEGAHFKNMCKHSAEYASLCAAAGVET
uniref:Multidrug resistance-associated protein n=2 Tax=Kalmanozyma brasiliensis (strain GHG001) TaxID=1365824 RepID=V5EU75_KALBG